MLNKLTKIFLFAIENIFLDSVEFYEASVKFGNYNLETLPSVTRGRCWECYILTMAGNLHYLSDTKSEKLLYIVCFTSVLQKCVDVAKTLILRTNMMKLLTVEVGGRDARRCLDTSHSSVCAGSVAMASSLSADGMVCFMISLSSAHSFS